MTKIKTTKRTLSTSKKDKNTVSSAENADVSALSLHADKPSEIPSASATPLQEDIAATKKTAPALTVIPASQKKNELGRMFKTARLEKGYSLKEVSAMLCIRQPYLSAIEEGRYQSLPWAAYTSGFIRSYAKLVGLDPITVMEKYRAEAGLFEKRPELVMPESQKKVMLPKSILVLFAFIAALSLYVIWYRVFSSSNSTQIPPVSPVLMASEMDAPGVSSNPISSDNTSGSVDASSAPPLTFAMTAETPALTPPSAAEKDKPREQSSTLSKQIFDAVSVENEHAVAADTPEHPSQSFGASPSASRVMIEATEDSWVEVTSDDGIHFSRVMQVGDRFYVKGEGNGYFMSTGNAKVLVLYVDGKKVAPLTGTIRRNISLSASDLSKK